MFGSLRPAAFDLLGEPVDDPDSVPPQCPRCGVESATHRQCFVWAARSDVGLDQLVGAFRLRIIKGAVPGREVEEAGAGEPAGEVR